MGYYTQSVGGVRGERLSRGIEPPRSPRDWKGIDHEEHQGHREHEGREEGLGVEKRGFDVWGG
jgi:hypothetical protein